MKTILRVQIVLLVLVAVMGGILKSGQSSVRPLHKMFGALAIVAGFAVVVQSFRLSLGRKSKILALKAVSATILAAVCGRASIGKPVGATYFGMVGFFLVAIICVAMLLKLQGNKQIVDTTKAD